MEERDIKGVEGSAGGGGKGAPVEELMGGVRARVWIMWFAPEWALVAAARGVRSYVVRRETTYSR